MKTATVGATSHITRDGLLISGIEEANRVRSRRMRPALPIPRKTVGPLVQYQCHTGILISDRI